MENHSDFKALLTGRWITDLANTSAFIMQEVSGLNWAGFYLLEGDTLYLGPFQGKPACVEISLGKGVCGAAALQGKTLIVPDVHEFPGHIACDPDSRSEIVIPLKDQNGRVMGVLDVDSPQLGRFTSKEQSYLEGLCRELLLTHIARTSSP